MKKNIGLFIIIGFLLAGIGFLFGPCAYRRNDGGWVSFYETLSYLNLARYTAANIVSLMFLLCGTLIAIGCTFMKPSGLKGGLLIFDSLVLLTAGSMIGCAYIFFMYHGPMGAGVYHTTFNYYTGWGVILSSIFTLLAGLIMLPVGFLSFPKAELKEEY